MTMLDNAAGKAQNAQGESLYTFLASLSTSGIILGLGLIAYALLKSRCPKFFDRRANQTCSKWKPASLSLQMLFLPMPDPYLQHVSGLGNYFFDRYLHTLTRIFLLLGLIIPPILIPLNVDDGKNKPGGVTGLDRLSFSNVGLLHTSRYWAHLVIAILVVFLVCNILQLELGVYKRLQSSLRPELNGTEYIIVVSKSKQQLSAKEIRQCFQTIAGGVRTVIVNRDYSSLHDKLQQRDMLINRLEAAETNLIRIANHQRNSVQTKYKRDNEFHKSMPLWMKYLRKEDRPLARLPLSPWLPSLPGVGPKVDAIQYFYKELARSNLEIEWEQQHPDNFPQINSAFVYFNQKIPEHFIPLALRLRIPSSWTLKYGWPLNDIVWQNVSISWWQQLIRTAFIYVVAAILILSFAFPTAMIGFLSQIEYLANVAPWLHWIAKLPRWSLGVIQGVLPPVMLAAISAAIPFVLRCLANMQGLYSRLAIESSVQVYYFAFLFVQVFLTVSISAGLTTVMRELVDRIDTLSAVLAQNLPKACNYFLSYVMIHTFTTTVYTLLQISGFVNLFCISPLMDKTARQKWLREKSTSLQMCSTFVPVFTNIACIGLIYSVIAPLILVIYTVCFGMLWIVYRYYPPNLSDLDGGNTGLFYPTAIQQLFTGIYFMELCLTGLFFLVRDARGKAACTAQAVIMIGLTALTMLFHYALDHNYKINWPSLQAISKQWHGECKEDSDLAHRREVEDLSTAKQDAFQPTIAQDLALSSVCPVVWIPKDSLGIADDEISYIRESCKSIWISTEGAFLDQQGKLKVQGPPPGRCSKNT